MNILMINVPYSGHVNPTLPLTRELVKRGHQITYVNAEAFRGAIEKAGATFVPYQNFPADLTEQQKTCTCFQAAYDTALALDGSFDLLVYEMFFYPGIEIARKKHIPCVRQFSQPAWSEETIRQASLLFRLSARLIDVQVMGKKKAAAMGLVNRTLEDAVLYDKPELNLVYVPEKFQKCRDSFDQRFLFLSPSREADTVPSTIPYSQMQHPIVYISLGSIISNRGFCKECIRAFGGKELSVILNTGRIDPASLGTIPANIHAYSFVPQLEVLEHADVFLTHCGMNSVNEAIHAGVPMVAMPFLNDQLENASQIVRLGLGKRVRSFPSRGKELYRTILEVSRDESIRQAMLQMQRDVKHQPDWDTVLNRIEGLVSGGIAESAR